MTEDERERLAKAIGELSKTAAWMMQTDFARGLELARSVVRDWPIEPARTSESLMQAELEDRESVESAWISVEDRLPEHGETVLVVERDGQISFASCSLPDETLVANYGPEAVARNRPRVWYEISGEPSHWMPIPAPPA